MKKLLVAASLAAVMGLGFYGLGHGCDIDAQLGTETKNEKTYIVKVEGDVNGADKEKAALNRKQVLNELAYKLGSDSFELNAVYDAVYNGFSITTSPENAEILKNTLGVVSVSEEHTYAAPDGDEDPVVLTDENELIKEEKLANYSAETMKATAADVKAVTGTDSQGGKGVVVGILDTGMYLNQVEGTAARATAEAQYPTELNACAFKDLTDKTNLALTEAKISSLDNPLDHGYTHLNDKIPFAYDYAGSDIDVDPTVSGSEHGTHVASLAAANGDDFQGIAPNAQIAVMKVFGDNEGGAYDTAIIAALNDAVKLHLDVINMSLGTDLQDYSDNISSASFAALKAAMDAGVICNVSAGNAGKSDFSSGDYADFTTDTVEPGMLGSYANYDEAANIVAASNPDKAFYSSIMNIKQNGSEVVNAASYSDQVKNSTTQTFPDGEHFLTDLLEGESTGEFDYIYIPGFGTSADYDAIGGYDSVHGKIAVVNRGNTTFVSKYQQAEKYGAIAMVCVNNDPSVTFNFSMAFSDNNPSIPVVFVFQNTTSYWGTHVVLTDEQKQNPSIDNCGGQGKVTLAVNAVANASDGNMIAAFSSDGPSANLDIGPTLSAPGSKIMGAVNATASNDGENSVSYLYGYENLSGTSMAAPNLTGAMALALGERNPNNTTAGMKVATDEEYQTEKKNLSAKAMATADKLKGTDGKAETSIRLQGAGRIDVKGILAADSYLTTTNSSTDGFANTIQSKAELKNSGSLYVANGDFDAAGEADIEFEYTIHNDSDTAKTYQPSMSVMIPELRIQLTHDAYAAEEESSRAEEVGYDPSVTFNENDLSTYPKFVGVPTMSVNDQNLTNGYENLTNTVTVQANSTATYTAKIRIDDLTVETEWGDSKVTDYSGTLKNYLKTYFADAGGTFVEGYLNLHETTAEDDTTDLSMPYLGFYGDYTKGEAVEDFDFEKSSTHIYNSTLTDNYLQHLSDQYAKKSAYTGSSMFATGSSLSQNELSKIGLFDKSSVANGNDYLSVVGGDETDHIYAGAKGIADHLNAFFFVNRSIEEATWSIKSGSSVKKSGNISDLFDWGGTKVYSAQSGYGICKSWLGMETDYYTMHRGYASIDVSSVAEGDYTLEFSFHLRGVDYTQTKSYTLTVDKTAPELVSAETSVSGSTTKMTITAKGATDNIKIGSLNNAPELVDGSEDTYTATSRLAKKDVDPSVDKVTVTMSDYAHNSATVILHPSDLKFAVSSYFFSSDNNFYVMEYDTNSYTIEITDKNGNTITTLKDSYTLYIQLATGLNESEIEVTVDGEDGKFTYNAATGLIAITMPKDAAYFSINQTPGGKKEDDPTSSSGQTSSVPESSVAPASSSAPESTVVSSTSSSQPASTSSSQGGETKKGCFGSLAVTGSLLGTIALVAGALALKKKNEDK